jgi:hypothetical protein
VVKIRKPDSSRARSREVFIVANGFKGWTLVYKDKINNVATA